MRYCPLPSVTAARTFSISTGLAASTVTPGRTAPELSLTTPVIDDWAYAAAGTIASPATTSNTRLNLLMPTPCSPSDVRHQTVSQATAALARNIEAGRATL